MTQNASHLERPESGDVEFLRRLHRMEGGSVQELCAEMSVTATAVRHRLSRLVSGGYVSKSLVRTGRGRPRHAYRVSERGLRLLGDNYSELAMVLWRELRNIQDENVRNSLLERIESTLADHYRQGVDGTNPRTRTEQFRKRLSECGLDVEVDESGQLPVLRANSCPYYDLASDDAGICELEQRVFELVLGTSAALTHRCVDGYSCCEFQVGGKK